MLQNKLEILIQQFWEDSTNFPFDEFFSIYRQVLEEKLSLHGMLTFEKYLFYVRKYHDVSRLMEFEYVSKHTNKFFSYKEICKAIFYPRYKHFKHTYRKSTIYMRLLNLYNQLQNIVIEKQDKKEKAILVDKCINAEHLTGKIVTNLRKKIEFLSLDRSFGLYTKGGLEIQINLLNKQFSCLFIDFHNIHDLNNRIGYNKVNDIIKKFFTSFRFRKTDIVGRWFSGDEIVIINKDNDNFSGLISRLRNHTENFSLTFNYRVFINLTSLLAIEKQINKMKGGTK